MSIKQKIMGLIALGMLRNEEAAVTVARPARLVRQQQSQYRPTFPGLRESPRVRTRPLHLADYVLIGCKMHRPAARGRFIELVETGYYNYERRQEWRTCALAAAVAGAFGCEFVERPEFSFSAAVYYLSKLYGRDLEAKALWPSGRDQGLLSEIVDLYDENHWSRRQIAGWLRMEVRL